MKTEELLRPQGLNPAKFIKAVPDAALGKQIGNAMSVNCVERVFVRLLPAAGLWTATLYDRWEAAANQYICPEEVRATLSGTFQDPVRKSLTDIDSLVLAEICNANQKKYTARPVLDRGKRLATRAKRTDATNKARTRLEKSRHGMLRKRMKRPSASNYRR